MNLARYSGGLNMFQKVSKSMSVVDFTKMVYQLFRLNPAKRYKIYSKVFISVGSFCFVDISNSSTVADLVNKELHQLTNNFSFFTEEVISEDDLSASNYHAGTITSRCSFRGSNTPLPLGTRCNVTPVIADRVICKGGGPSSGGHVVMSKGGGGFCHKQARLSIQSPAETCDAPAKSAEFPQEGNAPLTPCEQTDNMVPQSGGCIQSIEKTDRSITTLVSEVTSSASDFASVDGLGQLPDWCRKTSVIR
ncbi:uncharacterized protein LOC113342309 isoform X2 [Papaver somniferum]|uniref:uncharacterized protein LOC113342309 isoform X2 n=1 Tax=Papaver somniferum TaxID=3469 RepID=UPI000E705074|nr:uncharacterized protein LOC113342309 isoform X2 [Papaver somniferum]